jgi:putative Holliday junction resolvase
MAPGRSLAIDFGERRVGVAVSDAEGWLATPLLVLSRREAEDDFRRLAALVEQEAAARVVVGLPRTLAGEIGPQARRIQRWVERLRPYLSVPIVYWDEQYSTAEATRRLRAAPARGRGGRLGDRGRPERTRRQSTGVDAAAAAVILQDYLDAQRELLEPDAAAAPDEGAATP